MIKIVLLFFIFLIFTSFNSNDFKKNDLMLLYYKPNKEQLLGLDYNDIIKSDISSFLSYYTTLSTNKEVLKEIINQCIEQDVPINLAFSIVKKESSFKIRAINYNKDDKGNIKSIDRGLFQLNDKSFPNLTEDDFFNYKTNIFHGVKYLKYCIDSFDSYSQAISAYNGGHYRASFNNEITYEYVLEVINFYANLDKDLLIYLQERK